MALTNLERLKKFRSTPHGKRKLREWNTSRNNSHQKRATSKVSYAVKVGWLPRVQELICLDCGKDAQVYDHRNYLEPLKVEPVCRQCNYKRGPGVNHGLTRLLL